MAFTYGVHLWEVLSVISCTGVCKFPFHLTSEFGVYNPLSGQKCVSSFKTTTPRTITCCLDLKSFELTFWLNDRRMVSKTMKLPKHEDFPCGPWVPCVIMEKERNKVALNPHARVPVDFFQGEKAKVLSDSDFHLPQFHNTILVRDFETSIF